jgi:hypothetical protein
VSSSEHSRPGHFLAQWLHRFPDFSRYYRHFNVGERVRLLPNAIHPFSKTPIQYPMKRITSLATASVMLLAICHAYGVTFTYSYSDVFEASAEDHLVNQSNVQKINEGIVHYYSPITPGTPASLTYHFDLSGTITDASLFAHLASFNFGGDSFGFGSLWGSTDGTTWQLLMDAPTPSGIAQGHFYDQSLPTSLLGDSDMWIQVRMQASGWNILSQFSRTDINVPIQIFGSRPQSLPFPSVLTPSCC